MESDTASVEKIEVCREPLMEPEPEAEPHQLSKRRTGGLRTMPFIIINESFEKMASYGLMPNMVLYLTGVYHLSTVRASTILGLWSSLSDGLAIIGAFVSDSFLGRFSVITLGSLSSLIGMTVLWLTAMIPQLKPSSCGYLNGACNSVTPWQLAILLISFGLMSIGAGCIRPCSIAFGADQLSNKENPNNGRILDSYFNWYYASISISTILAFTVVVYIQENLGWAVGFAIPALLMLCSALMFFVGSPFYVKVKTGKSLLSGYAQVIVAACKKKSATLPQNDSDQYYHGSDSKLLIPSNHLRCLNKACFIEDPKRDLNPDGSVANEWSLCTVEQVESLKSFLRVLPIWSTGVLFNLSMSHGSFTVLEANTMDRHITKNFQIPAGSFTVFIVVSVGIWVAFYDRVVVPLLAKYAGMPRGLSTMVRMGIGILIACAAMSLLAIVETVRRNIAIEEGLEDQPNAVVGMSAAWLIPSFVLFGFAEGFNAVGQVEFYYTQFPKTMSSLAMGLVTLSMAISSLLGSVLVNIVDKLSSSGGKESWLSNNLNKGHLNYYYTLCCVIGLLNFVYFLVCSRAYGSTGEENPSTGDEVEQFEYRALSSS